MLMLEALGALWFWAQFSSAIFLPTPADPFLPAVRAAEAAWDTPADAWTNPMASAAWARRWKDATGCCVDFVFSPDDGACSGRIRVVQAKTLADGDGWRMGFMALTCG
ncbi:hypothetical protein HYV43_06870 [Candidatus Micrarchaeota archaeon]|nr:hypothetical protein [Candidatus Micrarchaeota archaeon]